MDMEIDLEIEIGIEPEIEIGINPLLRVPGGKRENLKALGLNGATLGSPVGIVRDTLQESGIPGGPAGKFRIFETKIGFNDGFGGGGVQKSLGQNSTSFRINLFVRSRNTRILAISL